MVNISESFLVMPCGDFLSVVRPGDGVLDLVPLLERLLDPLVCVCLFVLLLLSGVPDLNDVRLLIGVWA